MKKILASLVLNLFIISSVSAATIASDYGNVISQNYVHTIAPIVITAESDFEITSADGINLILDPDLYILWNTIDTISVSGTAVENNHIADEITPEYSDDYKILHIPILTDFEDGESVKLNNIQMRSYDREFSARFIGLDLDGDFVADFTDINGYRVSNNIRTDQTPPYPVTNVQYILNDNKTSLAVNWNNPPDYDVISINIERTLTRNNVTGPPMLILSSIITDEYIDNDIQAGDSVVYKIYAKDRRNNGEAYEFTVNVISDEEEPIEEPAEEEPVPEPTAETELEELDRLFNYYKIRYAIKCMPSGVPVPENDSACLWARIDLVYAQELLSRFNVDTSLTERDVYLMGIRLQYPEKRYQDNCIDASEPAGYCSALGKALQRIHYFVD